MLEDIEDIILFRISNYFLRFSKEYRTVYPDDTFMDWYEFVEYGSTDPIAIWIQRNGFTREAAAYMTSAGRNLIIHTEDGKLSIKGETLHVKHLDLEHGELSLEGRIDSLAYLGRKKEKQEESLIKRLFH